MALSQIVKQECPTCGKVAVEKSSFSLGEKKIISLECGHILTQSAIKTSGYEIMSSDGRSLMPYQIAGVKFVEQADAKCLIADEQGLGKTIQAIAALYLHKKELLPAVVAVPTTVKAQWFWEFVRWMGHPLDGGPMVQVIQSGKEKAMIGFDVYIVSYDMLKNENMFKDVNVKTIIIDECQRIKNHLSERAKAVQKIGKNVEHIIGLSGTPIKNNAGEYFTVLNLIEPRKFPTYQGFIDRFCDSYSDGGWQKIGGLKNPAMFHEMTKDFIIRRTKAEVLPDLPKLSRRFHHVELDAKLNKAYAAALQELDDVLYGDDEDENEFAKTTSLIAIMQKMRKITGVSKVLADGACVEFVREFLESTDRKIVVFLHHHDVATSLEGHLNGTLHDMGLNRVKNLTASLDSNARAELVKNFQLEEKSRVMIASTLAAGEGLNLQFCSDAVMLERQWNPANEEQAEARFHRFGQENPVTVTYMIATGTIDDYFTELVEQKRGIVASTLDNKQINWNEQSLMKELATLLVTKGKKKWTLDSIR